MAKPLLLDARETRLDEHERVIDYYREALAKRPETSTWEYEPVVIGPTWQRDANGFWLLPERTIGWDVLGWCGTNLQHGRDEPWRFTLEQSRFVLWWYAVDERGQFLYREGVLQRVKGHGKDPLGATLSATELVGPCRFAEFWHDNEVIAEDRRDAWVQTAAVSLEQTKNTMRLFPGLFTEEAKQEFGLQIGKETIYALGGTRFMQAHTSSPSTMEGNRVTFSLANETHLWVEANDGHDMAAVMRRNSAKAPDGSSRTLKITNAYTPGEDSVAEHDREAYEKATAGQAVNVGLLYDSIEAGASAPLTAEAAPSVVLSIRGDSVWLRPENVVKEILDVRNAPSQSRRWWYNQITASEESWTTPQQWDACPKPETPLTDGDQGVLFFDGSKSDDNTALTFARIGDGASFQIGVWARPDNIPEWTVPRDDVDDRVRWCFGHLDVVGFFCDPGAGEDEVGDRYWDKLIDGWGRDFGGDGPDPERLCFWAVEGGISRHAVLWDMRGDRNAHQKMFTEAAERTLTDIINGTLVHDHAPVTRMHVGNARRRPNNYGITVAKESRMSAKKIDACVTMIGAQMLRRIYMALPEDKKRLTDNYAGVSFL